MKARVELVVIAVLVACMSGLSIAAVPGQIVVQGKLTDLNGEPLSPGPKTLTFKIYADTTGGIKLWPVAIIGGEVQTVTTGSDGLWTALVGAIIPLTSGVFADSVRWLEIQVQDGANPPVTMPRVRLVTGPYAFRVATVDEATGGDIHGSLRVGASNSTTGDNSFAAGQNNSAFGAQSSIAGGHDNTANGEAAFVGGGYLNQASGDAAFVGGGHENVAGSFEAAVVGGKYNEAGDAAFVGGGLSNEALGVQSAIGGGHGNKASKLGAAVLGGFWNKARGDYSVVCGGGGMNAGDSNLALGRASFVGAGVQNLAGDSLSSVVGGFQNAVTGPHSFIGGGDYDTVSGWFSAIGGGYANVVRGDNASIGSGLSNEITSFGTSSSISGGYDNTVTMHYAFIGGGKFNRADADYTGVMAGQYNVTSAEGATIGGGGRNKARGEYSAICGGGGPNVADSNLASGERSFIGGGSENLATNSWTVVSGGTGNAASGITASVGGGQDNLAHGSMAAIGGGIDNRATGWATAIPGGERNIAEADWSFAAGHRAQARHLSSFVWAAVRNVGDSVVSDTAFQVKLHAPNGVRVSEPGGSARKIRTGDRFRDNAICAWAKVRGTDGATSGNDFGVASVVRNSAGNYRITVDVSAEDAALLVPVVSLEMDTPPTSAATARLIYMNQVNRSIFDVYVTNGIHVAADNDFVFLATAR